MESIFSTKERIKILQTIIFKTESISVNNIAQQLRLSKGLVSKYFDILTKSNVLKRVKGKVTVAETPMVDAIKILLNIKNIDSKIFKKYSFIKAIGLYGSCAKGVNTEDSDVDLWIRLKDVEEVKQASLTAEVNKKIKNAKVLLLTDKKLKKLKEDDELFYHSIAFGSIILYGDKDAIQI